MKLMKFFTVLFLCILSFAFAQDNFKETCVLAKGMGENADAALKDALSQAIHQVVGTMVDAETIVKNEEIISDKVLTYADGMVSKYDVVEPAMKQSNGLYSIAIKAFVQQKKVHERLVSAEIIKVKVSNTVNVMEMMQLHKEKEKDMDTAIKEFFDYLKVEDIMLPTLVDPQGRVGKDAQLHVTAIKGNTEEVEISMGILIEFDTQYYVSNFLPQLKKMLEQIAIPEKKIFLFPPDNREDYFRENTESLFNNAWTRKWKSFQGSSSSFLPENMINVDIAERYSDFQHPYQSYKIKNREKFFGACNQFVKRQGNLFVAIGLIDASQKVILTMVKDVSSNACFYLDKRNNDGDMVIGPGFVHRGCSKPFDCFEIKRTMKTDDLKKVRGMAAIIASKVEVD